MITTSADTTIEATARVRVADTPDLMSDHTQRRIQPHLVLVKYRYEHPDGYARPVWTAQSVDVTGYAILKPGPDGALRLGSSKHKAGWSVWPGRDVRDPNPRKPLPDWLREIVTTQVPTIG